MIITAIVGFFLATFLAIDVYKEGLAHKKKKDEFFISVWYFVFLICFIILSCLTLTFIFSYLF